MVVCSVLGGNLRKRIYICIYNMYLVYTCSCSHAYGLVCRHHCSKLQLCCGGVFGLVAFFAPPLWPTREGGRGVAHEGRSEAFAHRRLRYALDRALLFAVELLFVFLG